jgi:cell division septation protein DedD
MNLSALQTFYIVGAIVLLAIAIVAYPTLRDKNK